MKIRKVYAIAFCFVVTVITFSIYKIVELNKEKEIVKEQIKKEEIDLIEKQKTERTEERSQFWQKLIPWGNDENENNENI